MKRRIIPALVAVLVVAGLLAAVFVARPAPPRTVNTASTATCQAVVFAAYGYPPQGWSTAVGSATNATTAGESPIPGTLILDVDGSGAGTAPDSVLQSWVVKAQTAHIRVIGYSDTAYGKRSVAAVEQDVLNYRNWYHVTNIFLDEGADTWSTTLGTYYSTLYNYIHQVDATAAGQPYTVAGQAYTPQVWVNPGVFWDQRYMVDSDVAMVFEDTYASYTSGYSQPSWVANFPASRFAHVIHTTSAGQWQNALTLSQQRHAGHVYITDEGMPNPYQDFPSYWSSLDAQLTANCAATPTTPTTTAAPTTTTTAAPPATTTTVVPPPSTTTTDPVTTTTPPAITTTTLAPPAASNLNCPLPTVNPAVGDTVVCSYR